MVKKIIHISDIHIRNIQRHEEYKFQLEKFINEVIELSSEYTVDEIRIVITGDIFHQKIQTSNEQTKLLAWFLKELIKYSKVIIIAGNHDLMENNLDRMDSLTPIIELIDNPRINFLDKTLGYQSGFYHDDNIVWCLYSIFDKNITPDFKLEKIDYPDKKFIGLFHGALTGSKTDVGFEFEHGLNVDIFDGLDAVLCGDIHKRQELDYNGIKIVYPGSFIQQDRGESVSSHGYLLWDVDNLEYEEFDIQTDYGIYKFRISSIEDLENGVEEFINF